ncbi:MAG: flagellar basal body rod C-terminal domain-containing protein [Phenylobacterium sp.]
MDALNTASHGLMAAQSRFERSVARIANLGENPDVDLVQETVEQIGAKQAFAANAAVVRFSDQMWRSLLELQVR